MRGSWQETPFTYLLLVVLVIVFAAEVVVQYQQGLGLSWNISGQVLFDMGANYTPGFRNGEYWRTFTSCFLHVDMLHIFMNGLGLFYLGPFIERNYGGVMMLVAFMLTGVAGSLLTNIWHINEPYISAGASGGLYGLFGVIFSTGKRFKNQLDPGFQTWINQNLGLMVVFSFAPQIDAAGHFGGLALGLIMGMLLQPRGYRGISMAAVDASVETPVDNPNDNQKETP